jgi:hypothetical protein
MVSFGSTEAARIGLACLLGRGFGEWTTSGCACWAPALTLMRNKIAKLLILQ